MKKTIISAVLLFIVSYHCKAQDKQEKTEYTESTFYTDRVINGQSVELVPAGKLNFIISHRLGRVSEGLDNFFGFDQASSRLGLEYGINDWLMTGIGRSTTEKLVDGFLKVKLLRQSKGKRVMPFTVTCFSGISANTLKWKDSESENNDNYFTNSLYFTNQLIIARKFGNKFSLQISPTLVHRNMVETKKDKNDVYSIGLSAKLKVASRADITAEYYYVLPNQIDSKYNGMDVVNPFSIGVDIYTGKHVFQLHISNSTTMSEKSFITETTERWDKGYIHIGFNILRLFTIVNY